ncbi:tetratricopeptide repeat protein [Candidatus Parcubacteria bacterium]|nr:tetratricopeptide repeat protein [Candidatus Parcubacteria bacterium]
MSFELIPQLIIVISIGIIVLIFAKNIPKTKDLEDRNLSDDLRVGEEEEKFHYLYSRFKKRVNKKEYQKSIDLLWRWFEKVLRKIRISFLRFDNRIVSLLKRLREKNIETDIDKKTQADNMEQCDDHKEEIEKVEKIEFQKSAAFDMTDDKKEQENNIMESSIEEAKVEKIEEPSDLRKKIGHKSLNLDKENTEGKEKEYIGMIMKNPIDIKAYWKLGIVYSRRRNYQDAISCFRQITKIDPTYTKAKKKIADLIERMRKKENSEIENTKRDSEEKEEFMDNIEENRKG